MEKNKPLNLMKIMGFITIGYILLTRILLMILILDLNPELNFNLFPLGIPINVSLILFIFWSLNFFSALLLAVYLGIKFKKPEVDLKLALYLGIFLLIQPILLALNGLLLLNHRKYLLEPKKKERTEKYE